MIGAKHFSPDRQQGASFRFGLGIFSSVIESDFQTVPSLQSIGMLRAQNSLSFLEHACVYPEQFAKLLIGSLLDFLGLLPGLLLADFVLYLGIRIDPLLQSIEFLPERFQLLIRLPLLVV